MKQEHREKLLAMGLPENVVDDLARCIAAYREPFPDIKSVGESLLGPREKQLLPIRGHARKLRSLIEKLPERQRINLVQDAFENIANPAAAKSRLKQLMKLLEVIGKLEAKWPRPVVTLPFLLMEKGIVSPRAKAQIARIKAERKAKHIDLGGHPQDEAARNFAIHAATILRAHGVAVNEGQPYLTVLAVGLRELGDVADELDRKTRDRARDALADLELRDLPKRKPDVV